MNKNKHLVLDDRAQIEIGLCRGMSFKAIALEMNKDCTTISKEVKKHIQIVQKGAPYRPFNDCRRKKNCAHQGDLCSICLRKNNRCSNCSKCSQSCPDYVKQPCPDLSKPPYVCNGCPKRNTTCTLEKHLYFASDAQKEYELTRSECRSGFNLTEAELQQLDNTISPLLRQGQSLHHILANNPDTVSCCLKSAYTYADHGLFSARNIDMPRRVKFKVRKNKSIPLKVDKTCRIGRTYEQFLLFRQENPSIPVTEIDSVEGVKGGSVLLTIHFTMPNLQLAFLREHNDSKSVTDIFDHLYDRLGRDRFKKIFSLILADNGTEFSNPTALETAPDNTLRSRVFYCDPSSPGQKGSCEVNHEFIRRVIPKGTDLTQFSQAQIDLMMNHINSYSRPELGDKSPYEMFEFYYGREILDLLGIQKIHPNDIILKPSLLKS